MYGDHANKAECIRLGVSHAALFDGFAALHTVPIILERTTQNAKGEPIKSNPLPRYLIT